MVRKIIELFAKIMFLITWFIFNVAIGTFISELVYPIEKLSKVLF